LLLPSTQRLPQIRASPRSLPAQPLQRRTAKPRLAPIAAAAKTAARTAVKVRETRKGLARGSKRFGESIWGPFAKLSRILWLEMTGFFFGIFAVFAGSAVWAHRFRL
jgi:hypothetical protein